MSCQRVPLPSTQRGLNVSPHWATFSGEWLSFVSFFFIFKIYLFLFSVCKCFACVCIYAPYAWCLNRLEESAKSPGTGVTDSYDAPCGCWGVNSNPLQEH